MKKTTGKTEQIMKSHSKTGLAAFLFAATLLLGGCGGGSGGGEGGGDTTPTLNIADAQINEGNSGTATLSFSVRLDKAATDVINVDYATADASASQGSDYTAASGTLSIPAGDTQASITISVSGDTDVESDETLRLTLSNLSANATAGDMNATGTILNDDSSSLPQLSVSGGSVSEGDNGTVNLVFTASLSAASATDVSFNYDTSDGSASSVDDYQAIVNGGGTIPVGQTQVILYVTVNGDTDVEADETVSLTLSNLSANVSAGTLSAEGTILNDDSAPTVPTFTLLDQGLNGNVMTVLPAQDGSGDFYLGGSFNIYNQSEAHAILRLNADGTRDNNFDTGSGFNNTVYTLTRATDGSGDIYVGGQFTQYDGAPAGGLVRLNTDGSVVSGFVQGAGFNGRISTIVPPDDGSGDLYIGGDFSSYDGVAYNNIIRLNADGSVDGSFAAGSGSGFGSWVGAIIPVGDGSGDIYVTGNLHSYDGTSVSDVVRINSDGSLDTGFVLDPALSDQVYAIVTVGDGSGDLYVAFSAFNEVGILRLNSDGSLDTKFAEFDGWVRALMTTADGSGEVYAAGEFSHYKSTSSGGIVRLNGDGSVNTAFSVDTGFVEHAGVDDSPAFITFAGDGSGDLLVAGGFLSYDQQPSAHLVRLTNSGKISRAYSKAVAFDNRVLALAPADDGSKSLYAAGWFKHYDGTYANGIARIDAQGMPDGSFVQGTGLNERSQTLATSNDGSGDIYVGGYFFTDYNGVTRNRILRLNRDGSLDPNFNPGTGFNLGVDSIRMADDGSGDLYVGGNFTDYDGYAVGRIVRLNSDGSLDRGFNPVTGFNATVLQIVTAGDGSGDIYVAGEFTEFDGATHNHLVRLDRYGSVDSDFVTGNGFNGIVYTIATTGDGSGTLYAGGYFNTYDGAITPTLVRLNNDGSVDNGFSTNNGFNREVFALLPAGDGSGDLYVGGAFTDYNGSASNRLIRLTEDGSPDTAFITQGGFNEAVYALAAANDGSGKIFAGGAFTSYATTTVNRIIALDPSGGIQ